MNDGEWLAGLIRSGGVYYNVGGGTPEQVFAGLVAQIDLVPGVGREELLSGLVERERLMTTSVGHGIALPHPRKPLVTRVEDERILVCYLDKAVNFDAMDGSPVYVLFVILSAEPKSHLVILSRLSWLFQQEGFREVLRKKPDSAELEKVIKRYYS